MHERFAPVAHRFSYPAYMLSVDLSELEELDATVDRFGYNRRALDDTHTRGVRRTRSVQELRRFRSTLPLGGRV